MAVLTLGPMCPKGRCE